MGRLTRGDERERTRIPGLHPAHAAPPRPPAGPRIVCAPCHSRHAMQQLAPASTRSQWPQRAPWLAVSLPHPAAAPYLACNEAGRGRQPVKEASMPPIALCRPPLRLRRQRPAARRRRSIAKACRAAACRQAAHAWLPGTLQRQAHASVGEALCKDGALQRRRQHSAVAAPSAPQVGAGAGWLAHAGRRGGGASRPPAAKDLASMTRAARCCHAGTRI